MSGEITRASGTHNKRGSPDSRGSAGHARSDASRTLTHPALFLSGRITTSALAIGILMLVPQFLQRTIFPRATVGTAKTRRHVRFGHRMRTVSVDIGIPACCKLFATRARKRNSRELISPACARALTFAPAGRRCDALGTGTGCASAAQTRVCGPTRSVYALSVQRRPSIRLRPRFPAPSFTRFLVHPLPRPPLPLPPSFPP